MSVCVASEEVCAGGPPVAAGTVGIVRMEAACSVSADRVNSQRWRRGIQRAAMRSARPRVGSPCSRLGLHFAGLASGLGTVLVGQGGLECIARVVVEVVRGQPGRLVGQNYSMAAA